MHFGNAFDAVTRIVGIVVRRRNEITNLIRAEGRYSKDVPFIKFDSGMLR